jgi:hypothetical protein
VKPKPKRQPQAQRNRRARIPSTPTGQANPLQERDPELYKQLDELSRLPFEGNKEAWDEFCIEMGLVIYTSTCRSWQVLSEKGNGEAVA